jgi:hypothetical protein
MDADEHRFLQEERERTPGFRGVDGLWLRVVSNLTLIRVLPRLMSDFSSF